MKYAFWNNKGGTGKTSLTFQTVIHFAQINKEKRILVIDACPQANLSELFLGGLISKGGLKLIQRHGLIPRCSLGGYFQLRLPSPYNLPIFDPQSFITTPAKINYHIPNNIDLVCGDPMLELQANAINTLANNQIPGTNTWLSVIDWINQLIDPIKDNYDIIILDCNPSFSIYTQIAIASVDRLVLPVMADGTHQD